MTSNIGAEKLQRESQPGFHAHQHSDMKNLDELHVATRRLFAMNKTYDAS